MKKSFFLILAAATLLSAGFLHAGTPQETYIDKYSKLAVEEMQRSGVPASITLAQGLLESDSGLSPLAVKANNHFGIKCHKDWKGGTMYKDDDKKNECFRAYPSVEMSFRDHSDFLRYSDRYKPLFELRSNDYKAWAKGLKKAGYATDPAYPAKLCRTIEKYKLSRFDTGTEVPESPLKAEKPVAVRAADAIPAAGHTSESLNIKLSAELLSENGVPFVRAKKGQSYRSIASEYGLFVKEVLAFNDLSKEEELTEGLTVYLQRKKNRAARGLDKYIVSRDGETLRDISQRFGVRLKSLCRMNGLKPGASLQESDTIRLR